jgi:iron(III) transport system permease protein
MQLTRPAPVVRPRAALKAPRFLTWFAVLVALGVVIPIAYLVLRALEAEPGKLAEIVFRVRNLGLLGNTAFLGAAVLLTTTLIALPMAWLLSRTDLRFKTLWLVLGALPLGVPGYVGAFSLLAANGPGGTLETWFGLSLPRPSGFWGALVILTLYTFPYLFLNLYTALNNLDPRLEEAARSLGRSRWQSFFGVVAPQLRAAWLSGALLILLHVLGDFGVVSLMRFETFSYAIYSQYTSSLDRVYAAWLSLGLLVVTVGVLILEARLVRRSFVPRSARNLARGGAPVHLGWWQVPAMASMIALAALAVALPVATALFWLQREAGGLFFDPWAELTRAATGTISLAAPAAIICAVVAVPLCYLSVRYPTRFHRLLERASYLGYATPPLALALAIVFFSLRALPNLYQTVGLLIAAYVLHFLAESLGPVRAALLQTPVRLEEAGRSLGLSSAQVFGRVVLPLISRGVLASGALVFLSAVKELPLTTILAPPGLETLAKNVYTYTSEAMFAQAAPHALALVVVSSLFIGLVLNRRSERALEGEG